PEPELIDENGSYSSMQEVADYIHAFGKLPPNYLTKNEARDLGWESSEGNLWEVAPGMSIGGDRFGNNEGLLPDANGRKWTECDIDFDGGFRNAKRIVFSNDGLIYYTDDHYESFTQLY
ncbi:MAG: ribonuclease, partial [Oscillospiraceae bacterium]|nr:ribonuclease [Oscillospiraceae bacterium]